MQHSAGPPGSATARPLACWNSSFLACLPSSAPNHRIGTWFHGSTDPPVPMRSPQSRTLTWGCTPKSLYPHVPCRAGQLYPPHPQLRTPRSTQESKEDAQPGYHRNGALSVPARAGGQRSPKPVPLPVPGSGLLSESFWSFTNP